MYHFWIYQKNQILIKIIFCCRSLSNLHSQKSRSMKSVKIPWYEKPILKNNKYFNIQRGSMLAGLFSFVSIRFLISCRLFQRKAERGKEIRRKCGKSLNFNIFPLQFLSIFTIVTAVFDLYCLSMAAPGSTHYGYYFISYEFVYVGNRHGMYHCNPLIYLSIHLKLICLIWRCHLLIFCCLSLLFSVRNILAMFALFSFLAGLVLFVTSIMLIVALRKVLNFCLIWNQSSFTCV